MKKNSLPVLILMLLLPAAVLAGAEDSSIAAIYAKHGVEGTIIISSLSGEVEYLHNEERSNRRFLPASTFKILNTLIALEEGVIQDEKEIIKWDGHDKGWAPWNKDQTLSTAFSLSCVWCYQEFAKQIGGETYSKYLSNLDYGNRKTGLGITTFWLEGDLAISAREQITFLRKLYLEQLPFKSQNIQLLKKIMIVDKTPEYTLRAKTGWARRIKEQHGWYVGYLEVRGKVWLFANNIKINKRADTKFSRKLVIESLKAKGIL
jgi:beta-lactamase class D